MNAVVAGSGPESNPASRPVWPQLRHWYLIAPLVVLVVIAVGYWVMHDAADTAQELAVDQYLSLHHLAWLNPVALTIAVGLTLLAATSVHPRLRAAWPLVAALGAVAVVLVAASRIYMGVHYPSDVVCAVPTALAGCCFATGVWNTVVRRLPGSPVRRV